MNYEMPNIQLPQSWQWLPVGYCIDKIPLTGKKIKQKDYLTSGNLPVVDQGQEFIGGYTNDEKLRISCSQPIVVFGHHTKVFKYISFDFGGGADGIKVLKAKNFFKPKLLYYFLKAVRLPDKGYARHYQFLEKSHIPLPPLAEQKRIVAKIEELLTRLDAGVAALKKVRAELKRYRQAVLKAAFEGTLTADWRKANKDKLEPAAKLLERIAKERQRTPKNRQRQTQTPAQAGHRQPARPAGRMDVGYF